jgi:hypothetical protein
MQFLPGTDTHCRTVNLLTEMTNHNVHCQYLNRNLLLGFSQFTEKQEMCSTKK